jgi:peptide/nickel transport system substrate-binding protein
MKVFLAISITLVFGALASMAQERILTVGLDADPPNLDPAVSSAFVDRQVQNQIYDKLVDVNSQLKIVPMLATAWKVSELGTTYTFTLRQNVRFHDGTPFDASAVKYNLERYMNLDVSRRKGELASIKEIKVLSPTSIQIILKFSFAPLLSVLADRSGMMVSPTAVAKFGNKDFTNNPVGTGAFRFVERRRQDRITLENNADYWDTTNQANFDKLIYRPFPDGDVRTANLLSGAIQVITPIDPKDLKTIAVNSRTEVSSIAGLGYQGIPLNTTKPPFNNKALRQAFAATIDRETIDRVVFLGSVTPAMTPFPPGSPAYTSLFEVKPSNLELAKKKLVEGGRPNGFSFTLSIATGTVGAQLAQLYQAFAKSANIDLKIEQIEFGTLLARADKKEFEALTLGWSGRPDPDGNIFDFFTTGAPNNYSGYSNPRVDRLLQLARQTRDIVIRKDIYQDALESIIADAPYIITYFQKINIGKVRNVTGLPLNPDGIMRFKYTKFN